MFKKKKEHKSYLKSKIKIPVEQKFMSIFMF